MLLLPFACPSFSREMISSLGGASSTGSLGANLRMLGGVCGGGGAENRVYWDIMNYDDDDDADDGDDDDDDGVDAAILR